MTMIFPEKNWVRAAPEDRGIDPHRLEEARQWMDAHADERGYRFLIVRDGALVYEQYRGIEPEPRLPIASAAKSVYSNILGIEISEGTIPSSDAPVREIYPELMEVPPGEGPKDNRYAFPENRDITYRQLISNTSGYMKPGEAPGQVFHYQTYGMNVLTHALAKAHGLYDVDDPEGLPGFRQLVEERLANPIGAEWTYTLTNFDLHSRARLGIFGYYCQIHTRARDLARLGHLWCNWGRWQDTQVVPEDWLRESVKVNPDLIAHSPETMWTYGYGFWTNERGYLWPDLPREGFTASGAGGHYVSVFPSRRLVVVQNPGPYHRARADGKPANAEMLEIVLDALDPI
jgi:CubicO group peptidase (beta-lactamase class C family)